MFSGRRAGGVFALLVAGALLASSCAAPDGGSGDSGEGDLEQVNIAFSHPNIFTTGLPYYVARDKGFYRDAGLSVEATYTGGGSETVQAVVSGSADIGTETSAPAAVGAFSQGAPIKIVSASTTGLDLIWFAKADGPIQKITDLAGKKVGYSSTGSTSNIGVLALSEALQKQGLPAAQAAAIGSPSDNYTAVKTGQIAAGWTQPPILLDKVQSGELDVVAKGSDLGSYKDVAMRVNITNSQWAEQNPETLKRFLKVQSRSWDWIFNHQEEAIKIWEKAAKLDDTEQVLLKVFDYYSRDTMRLFPLSGRGKVVELAQHFGYIKKPLSEQQMSQLFDLSYKPDSLK